MQKNEMKQKIKEMELELETITKRLEVHEVLVSLLFEDFAVYLESKMDSIHTRKLSKKDIEEQAKNALDRFLSRQDNLELENHRIYKESFALILLQEEKAIKDSFFRLRMLVR